MKILVTGGLGYLGSHVVVDLLKNSFSVVIIDNLINSDISSLDCITNISNKNLVFEKLDLTKEKQVEELLKVAEQKFIDNEIDESYDLFSKLISLEANNPKIIAGFGKCLISQGKIEEAEDLIDSLEDEILNNNSIQGLISSIKIHKDKRW